MEEGNYTIREIKPVLTAWLTEALLLMKRTPVPDEIAVHDIRVLMKKCRAIMKLISTHTDQAVFDREYFAFRDIGRSLTGLRESSVHRKTLKMLRKSHHELFSKLAGNEKIELLLEGDDLKQEVSQELMNSLDTARNLLSRTSFRIRFVSFGRQDQELLIEEVRKSFSAVTSLYLECRNNPKPSSLHRLRKRVKDLLYQLYFVRPLNPGAVKSLEKKLDGIAQNLGAFNDLAQLIKETGYSIDGEERTPEMDELMIVIRNRQDECLAKVWPVAFRIFCPGHNIDNIIGKGYRKDDFPDPAIIEASGKDNL